MPSVRTIAKRALPRQYPRQPTGEVIPFPAPTMGMNTRESVNALNILEARSVENMLCESGKLIIRKGKAAHQTISGATAVGSMWTHQGKSADVLLAAANGGIYNVTGAPSALVAASTYTVNRWSFVQLNATTVAVNGTDTPWAFNGTVVGASGLSGSGLTIANLRTVHVTGVRMWFTEENEAFVWYLAAGAVTGVLTKFNLQLESQGGYCVGIYPYGPFTIFVMSTGEILAYQGDPGADLSLSKRYKAPKPVGYDPGFDVNGEPVIMTVSGPLPFQTIVKGLDDDAVEQGPYGKIAPSWAKDFETFGVNAGWNGIFSMGLVIFTLPTSATTSKQWVFNTRTKSWTFFSNLNASQFAELGGVLYFGNLAAGKVHRLSGGTDDDGAITAIVRGAFAYPFQQKANGQYTLAQLICTSSGTVTAQLQVDVDFKVAGITAPEVPVSTQGSGPWDGPWDGPWGEDGEALLRWSKILGYGRSVAPVVKFNSQADGLEFFGVNVLAAPAGAL